MPDIATTPLISALERYLSLTTASQQRTTSNMANVDTPGYRTRDVDFHAEMRRAMSASVLGGPQGPGQGAFGGAILDDSGFNDSSFNGSSFNDSSFNGSSIDDGSF